MITLKVKSKLVESKLNLFNLNIIKYVEQLKILKICNNKGISKQWVCFKFWEDLDTKYIQIQSFKSHKTYKFHQNWTINTKTI